MEEWVRPGEGWRKRWDVDDFGRIEHGFNRSVAWLIRPNRPSDAVRDEKYREAAASRAVLHPETDLTTHLGSARTIGRREIAGRSTWEVRTTGPAGSVQSRFYDEETGMLRAVERDELLVAGQPTRLRTVYDDWRPVEGVLFPHRLTRTPANGRERVMVLESVTTKPVLPEAVRPPAEVVAAASEDRYEVEVELDVMVPMRDGVRLSTDIHRPVGAGERMPVVLIRTPYNKSRGNAATSDAWVFAERGYVVLVQDERGKWASEGEYPAVGGQSARNDGYDTVEWIVSQPWSNGRLGTYGCSRLGINQYMLSAERHPAHVAMIPQAGAGAVGPDREGGALPLSIAVGWYPSAATKNRTDGQVRIPLPEGLYHLPTIDIMRHYGVGPTDWEDLLRKPFHDPWWQTRSYIAESDSFATPGLHVNSWYDRGADITLELFNLIRQNAVDERTREHQYVIISPMTHCDSERASENTRVGNLDVGDARFPYWETYLRWFDHWLKDVDNDVTNMPRVQYYVTGANEWRSANQWPVPEARPTRFYLRSTGAAGERMDDGVLSHQPPMAVEPPDRYIYDPADPVPSRGGSLCCTGNPEDQPGAYDQSDLEQRADVLVYSTPPLENSLDVVGPLNTTLYVSSSTPDTDFTVKLMDVHPDGRAFNVQEGIIRARYREGFDRTVWMRPGEVYEVKVDLHVTAHRFLAGHRVRVEVSSSNFPRFDRNLNTGGDNVTETEWRIAENAIHRSPEYPSSLLLHVVQGEERNQETGEEN
ncbi:MAG: CocE/NonD family hydrolase [Gemmatimonadaceae bacterium]